MKRQTIELHFLSGRFLKWVKINFTLPPIIQFNFSLILITLLILCGFNANAADLKVLQKIEFNKKASKELISTLLKELNYNDPIPETVYYDKFDLNNDKSKEHFLYFRGSGWCGSAGCRIVIVSKYGSKINSLLAVNGGEVNILNHKTQGYYDIAIKSKVNYILQWNGSYYQIRHTN